MNQEEILHDPLFKVDILMWQIARLLIKNRKQILEPFDLTCSQFEILSAIYYFSNLKTETIQIDLSEKANIDPMTTSTILRNLQKKRLVVRYRGPVNTRSVIVKLTPEGLDLLQKASFKIKLSSNQLYLDMNSERMIRQLKKLSDKLNNYKV